MPRSTIDLDREQAARLSQAVVHRRVILGYRSARSLSHAVGLDYRTIAGIERGIPRSVDRNTLATLEVGLNWPAGTIRGIIAGADEDDDKQADRDLTLTMADGISDDIVRGAMRVAQAAFDAYVDAAQAS